MRCLSIFVVLVSAFAGVFVYKVYLPLSPKIVPEDSLVLPIVFTTFNLISSLGEQLGISPRYKTQRYLTEFPESLGFSLDNADEVETIEDTVIAGVPVRIYRPRNSLGQRQERPGLIYFHGGGLVILKAASMLYSKICSRFANVTQAVVISVEYRRSPEHPFPAQFEDCHAVVTKVLEEERENYCCSVVDKSLVAGHRCNMPSIIPGAFKRIFTSKSRHRVLFLTCSNRET